MKADGKKFPGGRKFGPDWITSKMRERIVLEERARALRSPSQPDYERRMEEAKRGLRALEIHLARTGRLFT